MRVDVNITVFEFLSILILRSGRARTQPSALCRLTLGFSFLMAIKLQKLAEHSSHLLHKKDRFSNLLLDFFKRFSASGPVISLISFRDNV